MDQDGQEEFVNEALEMLDQAEANLLDLDRGGEFQKLYESVFRVFHSLKGGAGMFEMHTVQRHLHKVENTLSSGKPAKRFTPEQITFFLTAVDATRKLLTGEEVQFDYNLESSPASAQKSTVAKPTSRSAVPNNLKSEGIAYVVDDEPEILDALAEILRSSGITPILFSNPLDLLSKCQKKLPDLILTDIKMPQMNGITLLKEVRKITPDLPMIIVSGYASTEALLSSIHSGVFAVIEKPFNEGIILTYALSAIRQYKMMKAFRSSLNLIIYQFADLDDYLRANGKEDIARTIGDELRSLVEQRRNLEASLKKRES